MLLFMLHCYNRKKYFNLRLSTSILLSYLLLIDDDQLTKSIEINNNFSRFYVTR